MIYAIIAFLLNHASPTTLNRYACDLVNSQPGDGEGCYDWCFARALKAHPDAKLWVIPGVSPADIVPVALDDDFAHDLQNACAIVMNGGAY